MIAPPKSLKRRSSRARIILRWVQVVFLSVGLLGLGYYGYVFAEAQVFQAYQSWRLDQLQQGKPATVRSFVKLWIPFAWVEDATPAQGTPAGLPEVSAETGPGQSPATPTGPGDSPLDVPASPQQTRGAPIGDGSLLGKIEIPRIKLSAIIMEGIESSTLQLAVGHVPGTPLPGGPGNVDLAAHRDTFFRGLRKVHRGDLITMSTVSGEFFRYRVDSTAVVLPEDTKILNQSNGSGVNLITCYPFNFIGSAPKRFVVHADQIDAAPIPSHLTSAELSSASQHEFPASWSPATHTAASYRKPSRQTERAMSEASPGMNSSATMKSSFSRHPDPESTVEKHTDRGVVHLLRSPPQRLRAFFHRIFKGDNSVQSGTNGG
jgi:sortase A